MYTLKYAHLKNLWGDYNMADEIIKELWQVKDGIANEYNYETKTFVAHLRAIKNKRDRAEESYMKNQLVCYPRCATCQKARKWLDGQGIAYEYRNIKEQNPTEQELRQWAARSGLPVRKFFNTSGQPYKALGLARKLPAMGEDEQFALLATDGMLVKRPILIIADKRVLVGFTETEWSEAYPVQALRGVLRDTPLLTELLNSRKEDEVRDRLAPREHSFRKD
jgi:arsenate reductase